MRKALAFARAAAALKGSTSQMYVEKVLPRAKLVPAINYDEGLALVLQDKAQVMVASPFGPCSTTHAESLPMSAR